MIITIGWCMCPECGDVEYRELIPEMRGIGGIESHCLYLWCEKGRT